MQIQSIRYGLTRNLGNYESAKLEVEASPSDGQSVAALLEEVKDYLEKALPEGGSGSAKPPLAGTKAAAAAAKKAEKAATPAEESVPPWEGGHTPAEKSTLAKVTKSLARKDFKFVRESKTLEELLERFNDFRDPGKGFRALLTKKDWAKSINAVQDCYKSLNTSESDADVMHDLVAAINSERNVAK